MADLTGAVTRLGLYGGPLAAIETEVTLSPPLLTNSQTFYAPTITGGAITLSPPLLTNSQTFYDPTVSPGAVTLSPSLVTNSQTFYGPTVTSRVTLSPSLVTNSQTFYAPTVSLGDATLSPPLLTNEQAFFASILSGGQTSPASFYRRFKRKYALWINGTRYLGTQEDFEKLVANTFADTRPEQLPEIVAKVDLRKSDGFEIAAKELEKQLEAALKRVQKAAYEAREDEEILEFL